ncbi:MAG TPA: hypothetical protein VJ036_06795 [bacterium]|jgi:hypothetical protein|nr:hypothetical protein [bacterium]
MASNGLRKRDKFFLLPVAVILIGVSVWNWFHGWRDLYILVWFLIGVNNLLLLSLRVWPQRQRLLNLLLAGAGLALIFTSARLLWSYIRG